MRRALAFLLLLLVLLAPVGASGGKPSRPIDDGCGPTLRCITVETERPPGAALRDTLREFLTPRALPQR